MARDAQGRFVSGSGVGITGKPSTWMAADEVRRRLEKQLPDRVAKCAFLVEAEAKQLLSKGGGGSGNPPPQGDPTKPPYSYSSSAPGDPPYLRTGTLRSNIRSARTSTGSWLVGPTNVAWYGRVQEFGARINVTRKMRGFLKWKFGWTCGKSVIVIPKRPFMRPALANCLAKFPAQFKDIPLGGDIEPPGGMK